MPRFWFLILLALVPRVQATPNVDASRSCIKLLSGFEGFLRVTDEEWQRLLNPDSPYGHWLTERNLVWAAGMLPNSPDFDEAAGERLIHQMNYPFLAGPLVKLSDLLAGPVRDDESERKVLREIEKETLGFLKLHLLHSIAARNRLALFYRVRGRTTDTAQFDTRLAQFDAETSLQLRDRLRQNPETIDPIGHLAIQHLLLFRPLALMTDVFAPIHLRELNDAEYALLTELLRRGISELRTDEPALFAISAAR